MNAALRPTGNPLLDDALDDAYQEDLEKRNLKKRSIAPTLISRWVSLGYWAHIDMSECTACGTVHSNLVGVFLREHDAENPSTIRSTRLDLRRFRDLNIIPSLEVIPASVALCAECITAPLTKDLS